MFNVYTLPNVGVGNLTMVLSKVTRREAAAWRNKFHTDNPGMSTILYSAINGKFINSRMK